MELLHFLPVKNIIGFQNGLSIIRPVDGDRNDFAFFSNLYCCFCISPSAYCIGSYIQYDFCMKFRIRLIPGCKLYIDDGSFLSSHAYLQGIHISVYTEFIFIHGTLKTCNILIILALCSRKSRILSNTLYFLLTVYLCFNGCDGRPFCFISMTARKLDDITKVKSRVTDGIRIKRHIIHHCDR